MNRRKYNVLLFSVQRPEQPKVAIVFPLRYSTRKS